MAEGTITDMVEYCKAWEELEKLIEKMPLPERHRARHLIEKMSQLTTINVDIRTAFSRWVKGMPEHAQVIEDTLRQEGYGEALDGF